MKAPSYTISIDYYPEHGVAKRYTVFKDNDIYPIATFYDPERAQQYIDSLRSEAEKQNGNPT